MAYQPVARGVERMELRLAWFPIRHRCSWIDIHRAITQFRFGGRRMTMRATPLTGFVLVLAILLEGATAGAEPDGTIVGREAVTDFPTEAQMARFLANDPAYAAAVVAGLRVVTVADRPAIGIGNGMRQMFNSSLNASDSPEGSARRIASMSASLKSSIARTSRSRLFRRRYSSAEIMTVRSWPSCVTMTVCDSAAP
jgi:hypothetical protein